MESQVVGPESVGLRLALRVETIDARSNTPRDDPFRFGDLAILHADADGGHRGFGALVQHAEEGRLPADRIVVAAVYFADGGDRFPGPFAKFHQLRVLRMAIAEEERRSLRIVLQDRLQVLVERRLQAGSIAGGAAGRQHGGKDESKDRGQAH